MFEGENLSNQDSWPRRYKRHDFTIKLQKEKNMGKIPHSNSIKK